MSSTHIVYKIREKDEMAFESLYNEYHSIVYYVIFQIVKNQDITKDLVQETFFTVYNNITQYNGGNIKYWIISIAKNLAINFYNRKIVKENKVIRSDNMINSFIKEEHVGLGKYDELLDTHFNQREKDIIVYHVVFGYSYVEIGEMLDENPRSIGRECRMLLQTLKTVVEGE